MSHSHTRKEKICLNCGAEPLHDRYCHHCGQENVEPKQSFWHLITHFFNDVTHFDGKFFITLKYLLFRPGFLSSEYVQGKRMAYLDPVRMYLFISAAFFIAFLSLNPLEAPYISHESDPVRTHSIDSMREAVKKTRNVDGLVSAHAHGRTITVFSLQDDALTHGAKHYDSVQASLPKAERDAFIDRYMYKRLAKAYQAYDHDPYNFFSTGIDKFFHSISKIFFISLPIFAFILFLLYIRRRKQYYYVTHAIFSLHYYSVAFFFFLIPLLVSNRYFSLNESGDEWLVVILGLVVYLYIAMLKFYKQGWFKTFLKFTILCFSMFIIILLLVVGILLNSMLSVSMGGH